MPLVSLDAVTIGFGHLPLLDGASVRIEPRERIAVIGRNGTGKSTLLKILGGEIPPDSGTVWRQPGVRIARLEQTEATGEETRLVESLLDVQPMIDQGAVDLHVDLRLAVRPHAAYGGP